MVNIIRLAVTIWKIELQIKRIEPIKSRNWMRGCFYADKNIKFEVIEFQTEIECLSAEVKFIESNTRNSCFICRPDNIIHICVLPKVDRVFA